MPMPRRCALRSICGLSMFSAAIVASACGGSTTTAPLGAPFSQTDLTVGSGAQAASGSRATVAYTGWLYDPAKTDSKGTQFDAGPGFTFVVGVGQVIPGWDRGVPGMRVGGQRRLVIPPELAYGSNGAAPSIPPNATLVFDVTLLSVQ